MSRLVLIILVLLNLAEQMGFNNLRSLTGSVWWMRALATFSREVATGITVLQRNLVYVNPRGGILLTLSFKVNTL